MRFKNQKLWHDLLAHSFDPSEWYDRDDHNNHQPTAYNVPQDVPFKPRKRDDDIWDLWVDIGGES